MKILILSVVIMTAIIPEVKTSSQPLGLWLSWKLSDIPLRFYQRIQGLQKKTITIAVHINNDTLLISRQGKTIYEQKEKGDSGGCLHVLALNENTGQIMMVRKFRTYQPAEQVNLAVCLSAIQPGRVLILAGLRNFLTFLKPDGEKALITLGARMLSQLSLGEPWAMIAVAGEAPMHMNFGKGNDGFYDSPRSKVVAEAVATKIIGSTDKQLVIEANFPKADKDSKCEFLLQLSRTQMEFCRNYEGYGELCRCDNPYIPQLQPHAPTIPMLEDIPVVIVTANKPYYLYRILRNLKSVWGSAETKVLVVIDGANEESLQLAQIFDVETAIHDPQGNAGENTRTNMNIAFALYSVFSRWPRVDKAILLEDDLLLSPDLLSFFHQTAPALSKDPTLFLVEAFGQNSYPSTAGDPSVVFRADIYPQYGWMTCRRWVEYALPMWVPPGSGRDWDWWLYLEDVRRNMQAIVPEMSRTGHAGAAGAHVSGWEQQVFFNSRIMTSDPTVTVRNIERLESKSYSNWFEGDIQGSKKLRLTDHPCHSHILPEGQEGPFVLYLGVTSRADSHFSFYLMQTCLGTDDQEVKELYEGVMRLRIRPYTKTHPKFRLVSEYTSNTSLLEYYSESYNTPGNRSSFEKAQDVAQVLYLVGCPLSKFCKYSAGTSDWMMPSNMLLNEAERVVRRRKLDSINKVSRVRVPTTSADDVFAMNNYRRLT